MSFYDDAEFAAIRLARLASKETEESPLSEEMRAVAVDMHQRHGPRRTYRPRYRPRPAVHDGIGSGRSTWGDVSG